MESQIALNNNPAPVSQIKFDNQVVGQAALNQAVVGGIRPIIILKKKNTNPPSSQSIQVEDKQDIVSKKQMNDRRNKFFKAMVDRNESVETIVKAMNNVDELISAKRFNDAIVMMYPKKEYRPEFVHLPQEVQSRLSLNRYMTMKNYQKRYSNEEVMARMKVYDLKALEKVAKRMNHSVPK